MKFKEFKNLGWLALLEFFIALMLISYILFSLQNFFTGMIYEKKIKDTFLGVAGSLHLFMGS